MITLNKNEIAGFENYFNILNNNTEVYIFGSKRLGENIADILQKKGIKILGFIDNDKSLKGKMSDNIEIFNLEQIKNKNVNVIIASITYMYEIETQLKQNGFKNIIPFSILTLFYSEFKNYNQVFCNLISDYNNNKEKYDELYHFFKDEKSIKVLNILIEYRKTYKTELFSTINEGTENYFANFIPKFDVFVDGGAFDGDTVLKFIKFNPEYKKIYFFEPDKESFSKAKQILKNIKNIEFLPYGLSEKQEFLNFCSNMDSGSFFSKDGNTQIKCVALDEIVKEKKVFIKTDIEGYELKALKGAINLIKNNSLLAICVYHKPQDIREIINYINEINPNYEFYLRHYTNSIFGTVLYGVPLYD